jgi:hypothetical protein
MQNYNLCTGMALEIRRADLTSTMSGIEPEVNILGPS